MNIIITGVAGFIGSRLALEILKNKKNNVIGVDNIDNYYSIKLKKYRLKKLSIYKNFKFIKLDLKNRKNLKKLNYIKNVKIFYHLAAQAGVRYTLKEPIKYFDNNIKAFFNVLEYVKEKKIKKLFFASSSSVYGDQKKYPLNESSKLNEKNIYGFSKRINETTAKLYSKLFNFQAIGLRFFTVFGEWGRPDMLIFKYLKANTTNESFFLNSGGKHFRDFTYIDDVISILIKLKSVKLKRFDILNICSNNPINVLKVIKKINKYNKNFKFKKSISSQLNKVEVNKTHGNNKKVLNIIRKFKFTDFDTSLNNTIRWYFENKINNIS